MKPREGEVKDSGKENGCKNKARNIRKIDDGGSSRGEEGQRAIKARGGRGGGPERR